MKQTAEYWIEKLNMQNHPEGGYFVESYRSDDMLSSDCLPDKFQGNRNFATAIYFLLRGDQFSAFHRLKSDEVWHFYTGNGLTLYAINPAGKLHHYLLGPDFGKGEKFQITMKAGQWFAARVNEPSGYSLMGCTLAPGFDFHDFELEQRDELIQEYPQHQSLISSLT